MITNTGKNIISKYLIGNAPAYASYIALGCGAKPRPNIVTISGASSSGSLITVSSTEGVWVGAKINLISGTGQLSSIQETIVTAVNSNTTFTVSPEPTTALSDAVISLQTSPSIESLDFEMFRVPISSRGYINDNGVNKVVLTAELPSEERYEISEVGVFSAGSNSAAGAFDSKVLYAFTQDEGWEYHTDVAATQIPTFYEPLDSANNNVIDQTAEVFQTNADNRVFSNLSRVERYERSRFLNNVIMMSGASADLTNTVVISNAEGNGTTVTYTTTTPHLLGSGDVVTITGIDPVAYNVSEATVTSTPTPSTFTVASSATGIYVSGGTFDGERILVNPGSNHIHLTGTVVDLNRNAPTDLMKLAFSLISKDGTSNAVPDSIKILVEFASSDIAGSGEFARFEAILNNGTNPGQYDFTKNRYFVMEKELQELYKSNGFTWSVVNVVKISVSTVSSGSPTDDFYIALDAIRLDNISSVNPLYGMIGYSIVQNSSAETIVKRPNTSNYIEFRYILDVT
jgi:hypothetical protein